MRSVELSNENNDHKLRIQDDGVRISIYSRLAAQGITQVFEEEEREKIFNFFIGSNNPLSDDCRYSQRTEDTVRLDFGSAGAIVLKKQHVETLYRLFHPEKIDSLFDMPAIRKEAGEVEVILKNLKNFFK